MCLLSYTNKLPFNNTENDAISDDYIYNEKTNMLNYNNNSNNKTKNDKYNKKHVNADAVIELSSVLNTIDIECFKFWSEEELKGLLLFSYIFVFTSFLFLFSSPV